VRKGKRTVRVWVYWGRINLFGLGTKSQVSTVQTPPPRHSEGPEGELLIVICYVLPWTMLIDLQPRIPRLSSAIALGFVCKDVHCTPSRIARLDCSRCPKNPLIHTLKLLRVIPANPYAIDIVWYLFLSFSVLREPTSKAAKNQNPTSSAIHDSKWPF